MGGDVPRGVHPQCHHRRVTATQTGFLSYVRWAKSTLGTAAVTLGVAFYCFKEVGEQPPAQVPGSHPGIIWRGPVVLQDALLLHLWH